MRFSPADFRIWVLPARHRRLVRPARPRGRCVMNAQTRLERPLALAGAVSLGALAIACDSRSAGSPIRPSAAPAVGVTQLTSASQNLEAQLAAVRRATAKYHNIDSALADGYVDDGFGCIDARSFGLDPSLGGMGLHL